MTEVRASSNGALGLFSTCAFETGDVIVEETSPLVTLTSDPAVDETSLTLPRRSKKGKPKQDTPSSSSSWKDLKVPPMVSNDQAGNFRGMVRAITSYVKLRTPELEAKLLDLYHPALSSQFGAEETTIVETSREALKFLQKNAVAGSLLKSFVYDLPETVIKVMLVYSCNAFEGGQLYELQSRINHSCNPNAIVQLLQDNVGQCVRAAASIAVGEEITISYLGLFLYADGIVRQDLLRKEKHFRCSCERCRKGPDVAAAIPCPSCHSRHGRYLDEDTQYDDVLTVHYAMPPSSTSRNVTCQHCNETTTSPPGDTNPTHSLQLTRTVGNKVLSYIASARSRKSNSRKPDFDEELEDQLLQLSSTVSGARYWATNLMILMKLDRTLQGLHAKMISTGEVPELAEVADCIDSMERLVRFVEGLQLKLHMGHVLSEAIIGVARTLVTLGDVKSKKYASEWLFKITEYVNHFESDGMKKVVATLEVAWQKEDDGMAMQDEAISSNKRVKLC